MLRRQLELSAAVPDDAADAGRRLQPLADAGVQVWDGLVHLYPKLSVGGYLVVDDYGVIAENRQAVDDYRAREGIVEPIHPIDRYGAFWRRQR